jgi:hypothetical protein
MPKFIIRETTREIWKTDLVVEAESKEAAELLYIEGNYEEIGREYYDTLDTEFTIKEEQE